MTIDLPPPDADERAHSERLAAVLKDEIARLGPMPFPRFMERCLYAPGLGYYSAGRTKFGAAGDFVTAPELGDLFAQTFARALAPVLDALGGDADVVELGGGSGAFAEVALRALGDAGHAPARYRILEPSADLRERQRERLRENLPQALAARVEWLDGPPADVWRGVLFANEVIDALPATRFSVVNGDVFEEHVVDAGADGFGWRARPADLLVAAAVRHLERELGARFADGYRSELLPQLPFWMQAVLGTLERGLAVFVDYGYARRDYYRADRRDGTLACHYRHRMHGDALRWPGLQDLTASVDFSALAEAGESAGLDLGGYVAQGAFLLHAGLQESFADAHAQAGEAARYALAQQVKRLTLPGQMGEGFKVMWFTRDADAGPAFAAAAEADECNRL
ncbi:MAG: SAM-dependent methyltransferase [Xanthomonadales bacterium]|nr:SAM-dependent methyltransferase [Xanthomonadales bacterium]